MSKIQETIDSITKIESTISKIKTDNQEVFKEVAGLEEQAKILQDNLKTIALESNEKTIYFGWTVTTFKVEKRKYDLDKVMSVYGLSFVTNTVNAKLIEKEIGKENIDPTTFEAKITETVRITRPKD